MRAPLLSLLLIAAPALAAEDKFAFDFPEDGTPVHAPSAPWVAGYHRLQDEAHLRFSVMDEDGKERAGFDFLRSVDGAWQRSSNNLFVNDMTGSNMADCMILKAREATFASLRTVLNSPESVPKESEWIKPAQLAEDAHYYLTCDRWDNDHKLDLTIEGHTDTAGGAFKYLLQYDLEKNAFSFRVK